MTESAQVAASLDIPWSRLSLLALLILLMLVLSRWLRLGFERPLLIASLRGALQLTAVGYVLTALFALTRPELVFTTLLVMLAVAGRTATSRAGRQLPGVSMVATLTMGVGTGLSLLLTTQAVLGVTPWYSPQHWIPIGGMLLGNAMSGVSLASERLTEEIEAKRGEIEARLCLGYSGHEALHPLVARSLRAAMIPTLNSLTVAGVVQLPGMMTGQILSGVSPLIAVKYQLVILAALVLSVTVSSLLFLRALAARHLTAAHQLRQL
ncbi:MAG: iron export ABC transporter permease subunit FetB [Polyangiaceae bacterium]|nr:iron export ABC transporter permease subunit FetB [Polyangiaceae bacterium]MCW5789728.1 iron export ABC transporter permease subunit FetB [Polyangiaceae bacterium]